MLSPNRLAGLAAPLRRLAREFDLATAGRWILVSTALGIAVGLAAAVFQAALDFAHRTLFERPLEALGTDAPGGILGHLGRALLLLALPVSGAALSAWLTSRVAPEASGHGTDAVVRAYHRASGRVRPVVAPVKLAASMLTLGTGGSGGREGPIAQFGGTLGSLFARILRLDPRHRRLLLLAGAAAGVGAIFRAPLGGALFAAEVLYRRPDFEGAAVFPNVIAAIVAYATFSTVAPEPALFHVPALSLGPPVELLFYLVLGGLCAAAGVAYVRIFYGGEALFRRLPTSAALRAATGGLGLGSLAILFGFLAEDDRILFGGGYGLAQQAIDLSLAPLLLLALAAAKIAATTCTIASGGSGGVFAPSLAIGACLGSSFGQVARVLFPAAAPVPAACALVGMGGFFAGVAKTPLTAVILISEITGSYGLLVPMMLVAAVACLLSPGASIYREQVPTRVDSPAHIAEIASAALARLHVADAIDPGKSLPLVPAGAPLRALAERTAESKESPFAVVDDGGRLVGLIAVADLHRAVREPRLGTLVVAGDLARESFRTVTPQHDLREALRLLVENDEEDLVVVDPQDRRRPIAILSRQDLLAAYEKSLETAGE